MNELIMCPYNASSRYVICNMHVFLNERQFNDGCGGISKFRFLFYFSICPLPTCKILLKSDEQ
jgi:hypothetical protein